jgi:hypothetical protein
MLLKQDKDEKRKKRGTKPRNDCAILAQTAARFFVKTPRALVGTFFAFYKEFDQLAALGSKVFGGLPVQWAANGILSAS